MANTRILNDNAALRATLSASSTRSGTSVSYLSAPRKGDFWGSSASSASITAVFAQSEIVGVVGLFFTNMSSSGTMRVICYSDTLGNVVINDTGYLPCTPAQNVDYSRWSTTPSGSNGFAFGSGTDAVVYTGAGQVSGVRRVQIDLTNSTQIDAAFLVIGQYFEPHLNPTFGAQVGFESLSKYELSSAGDPIVDRGPISKVMKLEFEVDDADRKTWLEILKKSSIDYPIFLSIFPDDADKLKEHQHHIYGHITQLDLQKIEYFNGNVQSLSIQSV